MVKIFEPYRRAPGTVDAGADFARQLDRKARADTRSIVSIETRVGELEGRVGDLEERVNGTRTRRFLLPLDVCSPTGGLVSNGGWAHAASTGQMVVSGPATNEQRWSFTLIHGATLRRVRVAYVTGAAADIDLVVRRTRANKTSPFSATVDDLATVNLVAAATQEIDSGPIAEVADGELDTFGVDINPTAIGQGIRYLEVEVDEPGLENH